MAKNAKKNSINTLERIAKENFTDTTIESWFGIDIQIKHHISFKEMLEFVNDIVDTCFQDNHGFMPEIMDFAIKGNIITYYTNVALPSNLDRRYDLLYGTDIVDFVYSRISNGQITEIISSINRKVKFMCDTNTAMIDKQFSKLADSIENLQSLFNGVSSDDIENIVSSVSGGQFSEDRLVKSYLDHTRSNG